MQTQRKFLHLPATESHPRHRLRVPSPDSQASNRDSYDPEAWAITSAQNDSTTLPMQTIAKNQNSGSKNMQRNRLVPMFRPSIYRDCLQCYRMTTAMFIMHFDLGSLTTKATYRMSTMHAEPFSRWSRKLGRSNSSITDDRRIDNGAGESESKTTGSSTVLQENARGVNSIAVEGSWKYPYLQLGTHFLRIK